MAKTPKTLTTKQLETKKKKEDKAAALQKTKEDKAAALQKTKEDKAAALLKKNQEDEAVAAKKKEEAKDGAAPLPDITLLVSQHASTNREATNSSLSASKNAQKDNIDGTYAEEKGDQFSDEEENDNAFTSQVEMQQPLLDTSALDAHLAGYQASNEADLKKASCSATAAGSSLVAGPRDVAADASSSQPVSRRGLVHRGFGIQTGNRGLVDSVKLSGDPDTTPGIYQVGFSLSIKKGPLMHYSQDLLGIFARAFMGAKVSPLVTDRFVEPASTSAVDLANTLVGLGDARALAGAGVHDLAINAQARTRNAADVFLQQFKHLYKCFELSTTDGETTKYVLLLAPCKEIFRTLIAEFNELELPPEMVHEGVFDFFHYAKIEMNRFRASPLLKMRLDSFKKHAKGESAVFDDLVAVRDTSAITMICWMLASHFYIKEREEDPYAVVEKGKIEELEALLFRSMTVSLDGAVQQAQVQVLVDKGMVTPGSHRRAPAHLVAAAGVTPKVEKPQQQQQQVQKQHQQNNNSQNNNNNRRSQNNQQRNIRSRSEGDRHPSGGKPHNVAGGKNGNENQQEVFVPSGGGRKKDKKTKK